MDEQESELEETATWLAAQTGWQSEPLRNSATTYDGTTYRILDLGDTDDDSHLHMTVTLRAWRGTIDLAPALSVYEVCLSAIALEIRAGRLPIVVNGRRKWIPFPDSRIRLNHDSFLSESSAQNYKERFPESGGFSLEDVRNAKWPYMFHPYEDGLKCYSCPGGVRLGDLIQTWSWNEFR